MAERLRNTEMVVLLYGVGRNFWNMVILELVLKRKGYKTLRLRTYKQDFLML